MGLLAVYLGLLTASLCLGTLGAQDDGLTCPEEGCFCDSRNVAGIPGGIGLRISCHPLETTSGILSVRLPQFAYQLDVTKYGLTSVARDTFAGLIYLEKLDLQGNRIRHIADGSFADLGNLQVLDLSRNSLEVIAQNTFAGLEGLERLKLSDNRIKNMASGSLDHMPNLVKLDMADNAFICDCSLAWFPEWIQNKPKVLGNVARTKCALPVNLADVPLKKVGPNDMVCDGSTNVAIPKVTFSRLQLTPSEPQVVFEGDTLKLVCTAEGDKKVSWLHQEQPSSQQSGNISLAEATLPDRLLELSVTISKVRALHSGDWTCVVNDEPTNRKTINVLVMTAKTPVCNPLLLDTARGEYRWGAAVGGHTVYQPCQRTQTASYSRHGGVASLLCRSTGVWAATVNVSQCAYTSTVTDTLHKFATMNTSFTMNTLVDSAKHFINYTGDPGMFRDPMDLVYFSQAVENYMPYLRQSNDVGHYMMDMIANTLGVHPPLLEEAQRRGLACRRLLSVLDNITAVANPAFRHHAESLAIETYNLKPLKHFDGMACTWYSTDPSSLTTKYHRLTPRRVFHCAQSNKTLPSQGKEILASVVVPQNLYQQLLGRAELTSSSNLMFAAFSNSSLFPTTVESPDYDAVDSFVIGSHLVGASTFNLSHPPVYVVLHGDNIDDTVQPVWWDRYANGGFGAWTPAYCQVISSRNNLLWFSCTRLGYYGFRLQRAADDPVRIMQNGISSWHHPVVYAGSALAIFTLASSIVVYCTCHSALRISRELKHSLPNTWLSVALLIFLYAVGINQTAHQVTCRTVGIATHYLILASLLWMLVSINSIYGRVTKKRDHVTTMGNNGERQQLKLERPMTRFYLFAYGVGGLIVAICAAVDIEHYSTDNSCFLAVDPLPPVIGALVVPAALIIAMMVGFALASYCVMSSAPSHVAEHIEIQDYNRGLQNALSLSTVHGADEKKSENSVLAAHSFTLLLYLSALTVSGVKLAEPNDTVLWHSATLDLLLSILFSIIVAALGLWVFVYFCATRRDVLDCWRNPRCISGNSGGTEQVEDDMMSNLVEICPRPLPPPVHLTLEKPSQSHFQGSVNQPGGQHSLVGGGVSTMGTGSYADNAIRRPMAGSSGGINMRVKDTNVLKESDMSSDHLSVNNMNHLRRGYAAPVNSEADYSLAPSLFGPSSKVNNLNIHVDPGHKDKQPTTSSPVGSNVPEQDLTVSPLLADPYSIVALKMNNQVEVSLSSVNTGLNYTESSTIKMGAPCRMAAFDFVSPRISSSLPRRSSAHQRRRQQREDELETQSKFSALSMGSSSKSGHSRSKKRHKRPNRRRPRGQDQPSSIKEEPVYNNILNRSRDKPGTDDNYLGDDDQFDTLERNRPNIAQEGHGEIVADSAIIRETDVVEDDGGVQIEEEPASMDDLLASQYGSKSPNFSSSDIPKRETSV